MTEHIPMSLWGKDHWSTLAYIETRIVDYKGQPDRSHMRCDPKRHPGLAGHVHAALSPSLGDKNYPTRLKDGKELHDHDDWDCMEDAEAEGLLKWNGTGMYPVFVLTKKGRAICAALRRHKQDGGQFAEFAYSEGREVTA